MFKGNSATAVEPAGSIQAIMYQAPVALCLVRFYIMDAVISGSSSRKDYRVVVIICLD